MEVEKDWDEYQWNDNESRSRLKMKNNLFVLNVPVLHNLVNNEVRMSYECSDLFHILLRRYDPPEMVQPFFWGYDILSKTLFWVVESLNQYAGEFFNWSYLRIIL